MVMDNLGLTKGCPAQLWEFMAGSGKLSATARAENVSHLPPVDHRWGYHLGRFADQLKILYVFLVYGCEVLFASPTCTPWGNNSRGWDKRRNSDENVPGRACHYNFSQCCACCKLLWAAATSSRTPRTLICTLNRRSASFSMRASHGIEDYWISVSLEPVWTEDLCARALSCNRISCCWSSIEDVRVIMHTCICEAIVKTDHGQLC